MGVPGVGFGRAKGLGSDPTALLRLAAVTRSPKNPPRVRRERHRYRIVCFASRPRHRLLPRDVR
jgi:hypothetical protein